MAQRRGEIPWLKAMQGKQSGQKKEAIQMWQTLATAAKRGTTDAVSEYLQDAYLDKFNMYNFPVRADRIADDLQIPVEDAIASAEVLVTRRRAERIHRDQEPFPSYRLRRYQ